MTTLATSGPVEVLRSGLRGYNRDALRRMAGRPG